MANEKVLIVDDDIDTLRLVGLLLQRHGYRVIAAKSGPQALKQAQERQPDLILLDVMMPGMDGYQVAQELRANPLTANIPIIMFTAQSQVEDKLTGFQAGADDYITKPVHPAELLARIQRVLTRAPEMPVAQGVTQPAQRGFMVGILGAKGGIGATTVAINLGTALRQLAKERVIVAEMRPGQGTLGLELGMESQHGLTHLCKHSPEQITHVRVQSELTAFTPGLRLLLASSDPKETLYATQVKKGARIAQILKELAPYVLLDLGPSLQPWAHAILPTCDHLFIVLDGFPNTVRQAQLLLKYLADHTFGPGRVSVILMNRVRSALQMPWREVQRTLGVTLAKVITPAPELAFQAARHHVPMITHAPNSLTAEQFTDLAKYLQEEVAVQV